MIEQIFTYILLLGIIVIIGQLFRRSSIPIGLLLTITGMVLSFVPFFPVITLNPELIFNVFLPLLIYQISAFASWRDFKKNARPIVMLSLGHVFFITGLVAIGIHTLIPSLGWPMAFVLGAIISPPDDVAIVSIAEKIRIPNRVLTILEGEGLFNDAAALILFRFALAAVFINEFFVGKAIENFIIVIVGETVYGLLLGYMLGELRRKIHNSTLHIIASFITPFLAYLPMEALGGSGILATAIVGFMIGNEYALCFTSEFRLISRGFWPALGFVLEGLIFLLLGLEMRSIFVRILSLPLSSLMLYAFSVIGIVIVGRFIWVYVFVLFLPRFLFPALLKKDPYPPWQFPLIVSWAGMRGGISIAAALSIPFLPMTVAGVNARDLLIFMVFSVIIATLILQGLSLPWLLKRISIDQFGAHERKKEQLSVLSTKLKMAKKVLSWLSQYKKDVQDLDSLAEIKRRISEYRRLRDNLRNSISQQKHDMVSMEEKHEEEIEKETKVSLLAQILEVEREELYGLWRDEKISLNTRNKLLSQLDHRVQHHLEF